MVNLLTVVVYQAGLENAFKKPRFLKVFFKKKP